MRVKSLPLLVALGLFTTVSFAQQEQPSKATRRLGVVATAHLDTQWRWTIKNTIEEYILNTLQDNFALFERFPEYTFSFEGAFRYMLAREYYPEEYQRLKQYVADGRWRVTGSWVDAVDVNIPSFESLVRHALYGNGFYKEEFGKQSYDIFMPDCFGFGYALPSIANHCGLKSFSTQKLTWGCSVPIPFSIGKWEGVDGSSILSGLKTGNYVAQFRHDLSRDTTWGAVIDDLGQSSGCYAGYIYFGTGDVGGAPDSLSVDWLTKSIHSDGPIHVQSIGADDLPALVATYPDADLPTYSGELVMTRHGVGCYTSQAAMKRWNRQNEQLADAAERAAVTAHLMGGYRYPSETLKEAWTRFLWHQFHDDLTGTSIPEAYEYSWSDELLSLNQFSNVLAGAVSAITPALDTRGQGTSVVVYNPVSWQRQEVVSCFIHNPGDGHGQLQVYGPDGKTVPSQWGTKRDDSVEVIFLADIPSVGLAVYDIRTAPGSHSNTQGVRVTDSTLENERYKLTLNSNGDIASVFDKQIERELLAAPIEWQLIYNKPRQWPAWEIQYEDLLEAALGKVEDRPEIEILESGPVRGALRITRHHGNSIYQTTIQLASGDAGNRIDCVNKVDWAEKETLLKAVFKPAFDNDSVTYDLGLGAITRGVSTENKYEVPGHQWADLTARDGSCGLSVLNDCKYGWDHPDAATLRLTLIHTPGVFDSWNWVADQSSQDIGQHHFTYSISGHQDGWKSSESPWQAAALNQPMRVFRVPQHDGDRGRSLSLLALEGSGNVMINAVKLAEGSDEVIIRVKEVSGMGANDVRVNFANPVRGVREVNGQEEDLGTRASDDRGFNFSLTPYQPKAFAVQLNASQRPKLPSLAAQPVDLPFDLDGISLDSDRLDGNLDGEGNSLAGDLLPEKLYFRNVPFRFGPTDLRSANVVSCASQRLDLPSSGGKHWTDLYLLMLAVKGPQEGTVIVEGAEAAQEFSVSLFDYTEPMGQWDNRMVNGEMVSEPDEILPAYINHAPVAWAGTHRHNAAGENDIYKFTYLYAQRIRLSADARRVALPANPNLKLLAATVSAGQHDRVYSANPLYDEASASLARIAVAEPIFIDSTLAKLSSPTPGAVVRYTLDETEPTTSSPIAPAVLRLATTTTIRARAFDTQHRGGVTTNLTVHKLTPRPASVVDTAVPGLRCSYYEGEWSRLPGFDTLDIVDSFIMDSVCIPERARPEDYGLLFRGFVRAETDGLYEFGISSDDGSALLVADTLIADNDGVHGDGEVTGKIALKRGMHPIEVRMFQRKGGQALRMFIVGPGVPRQEVASSMLFH